MSAEPRICFGPPAAATRGSSGTATASTKGPDAGQAPSEQPQPDAEPASENGDFEYVPMSEWADEIESGR